MAQKEVQFNKLDLTRQLLEESEAQVEVLKKILKDKEEEILEAKGQLRQAKEDAVQEYHDSDALLKELGGSFADGFENCLCQVKASFPAQAQAQTLTQLIYSEGTDELFANETNLDPQDDGDTIHVDQEKYVRDGTRQLEGDQMVEKNEKPLTIQQFFFFFFGIINFLMLKRQYLFLPSPIVSGFLWV